MGTELVNRYSNLVWKYVRSFARKFDGFKNSPLIDVDDLYQECMTEMLSDFFLSGKSQDEYELDHMKIYHAMHVYVKNCLPVRTSVRTSDYTEKLRQYANTENVDDVRQLTYERDKQEDNDFEIDCNNFELKLSGLEKRLFRRFRQGHPDRIILKELGVKPGQLRWARQKIAVKYNKHNGTKFIMNRV